MQQLTNEEIARVFALYFGTPKSIRNIRWNSSIPSMESFLPNNNAIQDWRLLLTPLSAITDEHAINVASFVYTDEVEEKERKETGRNYINYNYLNTGLPFNLSFSLGEFTQAEDVQIFQYLIQQGYAVPLFLGVNHWANGKTAIELGIAIDKTVAK